MLELIRGLWLAEGLTVVLITHDSAITADAPRLVRLADGEILPDEQLAIAGVSR